MRRGVGHLSSRRRVKRVVVAFVVGTIAAAGCGPGVQRPKEKVAIARPVLDGSIRMPAGSS
jgi:hypothetical protein